MWYHKKISWFYFVIIISLVTTFFNVLIINEELVKDYHDVILSIILLGTSNNMVIFSLLFFSRTLTKLWVIFLFVVSAGVLFFTRYYGMEMSLASIEITIHSDTREIRELLDPVLFLYLTISIIIIGSLCYCFKIKKVPFLSRLKQFGFAIGIAVVLFIIPHAIDRKIASSAQQAVKKYFAPMNFVDNSGGFLKRHLRNDRFEIIPISLRHKIENQYQFRREDSTDQIFVLVIGESVRSDHLQINNYERQTTPRLQKRDNIISYTNAESCGTHTAISIPCILSHFDMQSFSRPENNTSLISVMKKLGFKTYFFSKHRWVGFSNCHESDECIMNLALEQIYRENPYRWYDQILFEPFDDAINDGKGSKFIILNMSGSHIKYDNKLPNDTFRVFTPICAIAVYQCDKDFLINSYDNTLVYLNYFLDTLYTKLENKNAMVLYTSDHGESLGEGGVYGHGKPNDVAPKEQRHVPIIIWMSKQFSFFEKLKKAFALKTSDHPVSHDNIFHSVLDCLGIKSDIIDRNKSLCFNQKGLD